MFFTVIILWLLTNQTARNKSVLALRVCVLLSFVRFTYLTWVSGQNYWYEFFGEKEN